MGSDNPKLGCLVSVDPHLIEPPDVCLEADHPRGATSRPDSIAAARKLSVETQCEALRGAVPVHSLRAETGRGMSRCSSGPMTAR